MKVLQLLPMEALAGGSGWGAGAGAERVGGDMALRMYSRKTLIVLRLILILKLYLFSNYLYRMSKLNISNFLSH